MASEKSYGDGVHQIELSKKLKISRLSMIKKFDVCVLGLGYVGLPTALIIAKTI